MITVGGQGRLARVGAYCNTPLQPVSFRTPAGLAIILASVLLFGASAAWAQAPASRHARPTPPVPAVHDTAPAGEPKSDSIYATEITVDITGATIIDRSGHRRHLTKGLVLPEIPDLKIPHQFPDLSHLGNVEVHRDDLIHLTTDVTVGEDEIVRGDVVSVFGGHVDIKGEVTGSAIAVFGSIDIDGKVGEDAVAPFGQVHVGSTGSVRKDVVASDVVKDPGGRIGGTRHETPINLVGRGPWGVSRLADPATTLTVFVVVNIVFWLFLVILAHALAARNVAKVKDRIQRSFFKSFFMGVLAQILLLPAMLLLLVTIIGIPVVIFLMPLMIAGAIVLSQAATGLLVGEKVDQNVGLNLKTPLARTLTGFLILQSLSLVAVGAMWASGNQTGSGFLRLVAFALFGLSLLLAYVVVTVGSGAVVTTRFGTRPKDVAPVASADQARPDTDPHAHHGPTPLPHPGTDSTDTAPAVG